MGDGRREGRDGNTSWTGRKERYPYPEAREGPSPSFPPPPPLTDRHL